MWDAAFGVGVEDQHHACEDIDLLSWRAPPSQSPVAPKDISSLIHSAQNRQKWLTRLLPSPASCRGHIPSPANPVSNALSTTAARARNHICTTSVLPSGFPICTLPVFAIPSKRVSNMTHISHPASGYDTYAVCSSRYAVHHIFCLGAYRQEPCHRELTSRWRGGERYWPYIERIGYKYSS
ncbi:hypothetical protein BV22DRAFT_792705 [Leucogyrophana mollusca]|uniref:Uncharacterized protein n=1 Tax=Leucogyrophana mollusca TaxID=85980 RepID=A0ACB8B471_9AGAM|nr:hypothetical protein BV22DRAFT_792705 [Leucogyrophana mollusca]